MSRKAENFPEQFRGVRLIRSGKNVRNSSIGFIFQFHFLIKELTAIENVALPLRKSGMCEKEAQERSLAVLEKLGLGSKAQRFANKLRW